MTILVVEDDQDTREFIVLLLELARYQVVEAGSGGAALATIVQKPVHAMLLDMRLPDMDGIDVCRQCRALGYSDIPIILMTADIATEITTRATDAGVTAYLNKPFDPQALIDLLEALPASLSIRRRTQTSGREMR